MDWYSRLSSRLPWLPKAAGNNEDRSLRGTFGTQSQWTCLSPENVATLRESRRDNPSGATLRGSPSGNMWIPRPIPEEADQQRLIQMIRNFERGDWNTLRQDLASVLDGAVYEFSMCTLLFCNLCLVIIETDSKATCIGDDVTSCEPPPSMVGDMCLVLLVIYIFELFVKCYVYRQSYWSDPWGAFEIFVVGSSSLAELINFGTPALDTVAMSCLRLFRLARLCKIFHVMIYFRQLYTMMQRLLKMFKPILWASTLLILCLTLWAIVAVLVLHPINVDVAKTKPKIYEGCERCPRAFASVWSAYLTLWQTIIVGDSWSTIAVPIMEHSMGTFIIFYLVVATVSFGVSNLILAMIVNTAGEGRASDIAFQDTMLEITREDQTTTLEQICRSIDIYRSGLISTDEIFEAYENDPEFREVMHLMKLDKKDLDVAVRLAEIDEAGDVNYKDFVGKLVKMKSGDPGKTMMMFFKQDLVDLRRCITRELGDIKKALQEREVPMCPSGAPTELRSSKSQILHRTTTDHIGQREGGFSQRMGNPYVDPDPVSPHSQKADKPADVDIYDMPISTTNIAVSMALPGPVHPGDDNSFPKKPENRIGLPFSTDNLNGEQRERLYRICDAIDIDLDICISDELLEAYEADASFRRVSTMTKLNRTQMDAALRIVDEDKSVDVDYMQFITMLMKLKSMDPGSLMMILKHKMDELQTSLMDEMEQLRYYMSQERTIIQKHDQMAISHARRSSTGTGAVESIMTNQRSRVDDELENLRTSMDKCLSSTSTPHQSHSRASSVSSRNSSQNGGMDSDMKALLRGSMGAPVSPNGWFDNDSEDSDKKSSDSLNNGAASDPDLDNIVKLPIPSIVVVPPEATTAVKKQRSLVSRTLSLVSGKFSEPE